MLADGWIAEPPLAWLASGALAAVKATVLLLAATAVAWLLRSRSSALRHLVWTVALAAALALPALEAGLPGGVRVPAVDLPLAAGPPAARDRPGAAAAHEPAATGPVGSGMDAGALPAGGTTGAGPASVPGRGGSGAPGGWLGIAGWAALLVWAAGAGFVLLRTGWAAFRLGRVRRRADRLADPVWRRRAREICGEMGGKARPSVRVSPEVSVPFTIGPVRPTLVLPQEALDEWPRRRTEAVLVHELGHVLRRDPATQLMGRLACAVYWFHPLVWKAAGEAAKERERACDDLVLRAGERASEYARHLLEVARQADPPALASATAVSVARPADLEGRVLSVLAADADRRPASRSSAAAAVVPALVLTLGLALPSVEAGDRGAREAVPAAEGSPARSGAGPRDDRRAGSAERAASAERSSTDTVPPPGAGRPDRGTLVPSLLGLLDDSDPSVRAAAAGALGEMRVGRAVPRLSQALEDPSPEVRRAAAGALGEIEDPDAVGALGRVLASDGDRRVRKAAAWALGETESPEAVEVLEKALSEVESRWLRGRLVDALGETRVPSAVPVLERLLYDPGGTIHERALGALVENGTHRARAALGRALESDDPELRAAAARALGHHR